MGFLNTMANTPLANMKKQKFNKSRVNCTTQDFLTMKPVFCSEVMPHEDIDINMGAFSRLAPMVRPAYARCKMVNRAFFVPYRTVFPQWNAFITQSTNNYGNVPHSVPTLLQTTLAFSLVQTVVDKYGSIDKPRGVVTSDPDWISYIDKLFLKTTQDELDAYFDAPADFIIYWSDDENDSLATYFLNESLDPSDGVLTINSKTYYPAIKLRFGNFNKRMYDLFINLGYNIQPSVLLDVTEFNGLGDDPRPQNIRPKDENSWDFFEDLRDVSALPFLSYLKVWSDWYSYQQWKPVIDGTYIEEYFTDSQLLPSYTGEDILKWCKFVLNTQYGKDYFTCAEENPMARYDTQNIVINDPTLPETESQVNNITTLQTPVAKDPDGMLSFSQFMVDGLRKLTNYMMRNKIAGGRILDRMLVQYGVKLDSEKLLRSVYLGKYEQPIQIMDVTATAMTEVNDSVQYLGDYAGKGVSQGNGHFSLKNEKEFGQLIIVSVIVPEISYYQGLKREMHHIEPFDFFNSAYDNLGYQAVRPDEVINVWDSQRSTNVQWILNKTLPNTGVFGFLPRYAEYKCSDGMDVLSGDYRISSAGADSLRYFNLFRELTNDTFNNDSIVNSPYFAFANDREQYDRIFSDTSITFDHFLTFFSFEVTSYQPTTQLFDSYDFGDENEHNPHAKMSYGGTRFV